jgi:hypothetical protein
MSALLWPSPSTAEIEPRTTRGHCQDGEPGNLPDRTNVLTLIRQGSRPLCRKVAELTHPSMTRSGANPALPLQADRRRRRVLPVRRRALTAAAVIALFAAPGCSVFAEAVSRSSPPTTSSTIPFPVGGGTSCISYSDGTMACSTPGRPLRRRRRRGLLLPVDDGEHNDEARIEYASVASFGELGLELMALGAPTALVARCHRAAIDEIAHATALDRLAGRDGSRFGAIPHLLGRRIGGRFGGRRRHLARIAVTSYRDGWLNEGLSAADMEERAQTAARVEERRAFERIAAEERAHAELGRDVVLWCFEESPEAVGRALARA